jgi:ParB family chromosome partitioning protein
VAPPASQGRCAPAPAADEVFYELVGERVTANALLVEVAGKGVADANVVEKTKTQKQIIRDCLSGNGRAKVESWLRGFMAFPFQLYGDGNCTIADAAGAVADLFPIA